jgi:hypothetical protein
MKTSTKKLIELIYKSNEKDSSILPDVIKYATATYDTPSWSSETYDPYDEFKDRTSDMRFIAWSGIKGVEWKEVFNWFKDPEESNNRDTFLKEWEDEKVKIMAKDTKINQKFIDMVKPEMNIIIQKKSLIIDDDLEDKWSPFTISLLEEDCTNYDVDNFKEIMSNKFSQIIYDNKLTIRWESLLHYYLNKFREAYKNTTVVDLKGLYFWCVPDEKEKLLKDVEQAGGIWTDHIDNAHIVVYDDYTKINVDRNKYLVLLRRISLEAINGLFVYRSPNSLLAEIAKRKEFMQTQAENHII